MQNADTITIEKIMNAPVEKVWAAWATPGMVSKWFGSNPNGTVQYAQLDVRVGGSFKVSFSNADGSPHTCFGVYTVVKPYSMLGFTWAWIAEPGVESLVTVKLTPQGNKTLMLFTHANVGYASAHNYLKGWGDTFLKLERALATE